MVFDKLQSINRKTAAVCVAALLTDRLYCRGRLCLEQQ